MAFSNGANPYIGDLSEFLPQPAPFETAPLAILTEHFALQNTLDELFPATRVPLIVHSVFQLMFAIITYVPILIVIQEKPLNYQISLASSSQLVLLLNVENLGQ